MLEVVKLLNPRIKPRYAEEEELKTAKAVLGVPFNSYRKDGTPDNSNKVIAEKSYKIAEERKLPLYGQPEELDLMQDTKIEKHRFPSELGDWVKTEQLVKWMATQVGRRTPVILVGHQHHMRRAAALAKYYGLVSLVIDDCKDVPYDKNGGQWWCRNAATYIPWEYASRARLIVLNLLGKL